MIAAAEGASLCLPSLSFSRSQLLALLLLCSFTFQDAATLRNFSPITLLRIQCILPLLNLLDPIRSRPPPSNSSNSPKARSSRYCRLSTRETRSKSSIHHQIPISSSFNLFPFFSPLNSSNPLPPLQDQPKLCTITTESSRLSGIHLTEGLEGNSENVELSFGVDYDSVCWESLCSIPRGRSPFAAARRELEEIEREVRWLERG